ncbi:MAG: pilus assembly protein PilM [Pyrinomonadaceae bacterium]|nr:pilus assembly protein PilM [Phycisphaerales bacterium]
MNYPGKTSPIGVDITAHWLRAVQIVGSGPSARLAACAVIPRAQSGTADLAMDAKRLAGALRRQSFTGSEVVLAVPDDKLLSSVMELPPRSSGAPVEQLAAAEFARIHRSDPARLELALWDVPSPGGAGPRAAASQYMAVACLHNDSDPILSAFDDAGLDVLALNARSLAVACACQSLLAPSPRMNALLHVGWSSTSLWIVIDGVLAYERQLESTELGVLFRGITENTGLTFEAAEEILTTPARGELQRREQDEGVRARDFAAAHAEAMTEQLRVSLSYVTRKYPQHGVDQILLVGDCGLLPALGACIASAGLAARPVVSSDLLQVPGQQASGATAGGSNGGGGSGGAELVTAIGLAHYSGEAA